MLFGIDVALTFAICYGMAAGEKRFKQELLFFGADSQTIVLNTHPHCVVKFTDFNIDRGCVLWVFYLA